MMEKRNGLKVEISRGLKPGPAPQSASTATENVYIRVRQSLVVSDPTIANPTTVNPPPSIPQSSGHLYLIKGSIDDIRRFAGATVDWIIKVAHLICDPSGAGQVYTHRTGTPLYWYDRDRDASGWVQVNLGDPLVPGIYEFVTTGGPITLSKISERQSRSETSVGSDEFSSASFHRDLELRDGKACVVNGADRALIPSHLVPKRIGTDGAKDVVTRFVGAGAALDIHRFHPDIGVLLFCPLEYLVDNYMLGFYHVAGQIYTLHNFDPDDPDVPFTGTTFTDVTDLPPLHMYSVTLSVHDARYRLPPKGVFDWHYLQCVLRRFATDQYKNLPNNSFFVYPFEKLSENGFEDNANDDDDDEPPYYSYCVHRVMAEHWEKRREQEQFKEIEKWSSEITSPGVERGCLASVRNCLIC
ncbi:hypothetical protein D9615_007863 [Tricholomella constricta]|uniref:Uncharacterized protein n=1 Tax=Tricholomella constricta TaxID=117010 RepID=A0A8H5M0F1_9AGAR|nr:hypothetical protein D9615_007863 [Tricholomella constricta]